VDGSNDEILMGNVQYDTESLLTQFDYGNGLQTTFSYDSRDRPLAIDVKNAPTPYVDIDYTYDSNNNITQLVNGWRDTDSTWNSDTESYNYDGLDRLTSAYCTSWSHTYVYDKVGNRLSKDSVTYTNNTVNQITALSDGTSFAYDSNGNRTQKTDGTHTWSYTYDYANRLTKFEKNSNIIGEYVYDGDGKRLQVTENSVTTTYVYSGLNVLYEENTTGTAAYIYGPTGLLARKTTIDQEANTFYYHTDHLGSTRLITDSDRNIIAAVIYHPFGEPSIEEGSEHYLFTGKERDATGLYYYGARYYDPGIGRFITRDPLAGTFSLPQTLNRYTYCANNPSKYIDPAGLDFEHEDEEVGEILSEEEKEEPPVLVFQLDEDTLLTLDIYVQEGNVLIGYGYLTSTNLSLKEPNFQVVIVIIVFNDEGDMEDHKEWDWDKMKGALEKDVSSTTYDNLRDIADQMKDFVGPEHVQELSAAVNSLYLQIRKIAYSSPWEAIAKGAIGGALSSPFTNPAVGAGAGALTALSEHYKWYKLQTFLGGLILGGFREQPT
jgi:RHS repeat-associated protein